MRKEALALSIILVLAGAAPAMAASGCPDSEILFEDSFEDVDSSWNPDGKDVSIKDGKFVIAPSSGEYNMLLRIYSGDIFDGDMDLCVSMAIADYKERDWAQGGVVFWASDYRNYYRLMLSDFGELLIARRIKGKKTIYPTKWVEKPSIKKGKGAVNDIKISFRGRKATIYVNGEKVYTLKGRPPRDGSQIGFVAVSPLTAGVPPTKVEFTNLVITEPGIGLSSAPAASRPDAKAVPEGRATADEAARKVAR